MSSNPSDPNKPDADQADQVDATDFAETQHSLSVSNDTNNPISAVTEENIDPLEAKLVAYLDNELSPEDVAELETRLADDAELRQRLHELQATWDMLDELPAAQPNPAFLKSTMELAVTNTGKRKQKWHRWPLRIAAGMLVFSVAAASAMNYTRSVQQAPYVELVSNLDFYENSRLYELTDVAFLELMHSEKVFGDMDISLNADSIPQDMQAISSEQTKQKPSTFESNKKRFDELSEWKIAELNGRMQALQKNSPEAQAKLKKLREIHTEILKRENGKELMETLQEFSRLYYGFSSTEKTRFLPRTPEQKIRFIRDYRMSSAQAELDSNVQLTQVDVAALREWNKKFITKNKDVLVELIQQRIKQRGGSRSSDSNKEKEQISRWLSRGVGLMMVRSEEDQAKIMSLIDEDLLASLQAKVSDEVAQVLESMDTLVAKQKAVFKWASAAESSRVRIRVPFEDLQRHYETALSDAERQIVDRLLPQERKRALMNSFLHDISPLNRNRSRGGRRSNMML